MGFGPGVSGCSPCNENCGSCSQTHRCERCLPSFSLIGDQVNGSCVNDPYCFPGCAACNGSAEIIADEAAGTMTDPSVIVETVFCVNCTAGRFNTGTACYECPPGCRGCELDGDRLWEAVTDFWEITLNETITYQGTIGNTDVLPPFNPDETSVGKKTTWIEVYMMTLQQ